MGIDISPNVKVSHCKQWSEGRVGYRMVQVLRSGHSVSKSKWRVFFLDAKGSLDKNLKLLISPELASLSMRRASVSDTFEPRQVSLKQHLEHIHFGKAEPIAFSPKKLSLSKNQYSTFDR